MFSSNSEAYASELLENYEEMFLITSGSWAAWHHHKDRPKVKIGKT